MGWLIAYGIITGVVLVISGLVGLVQLDYDPEDAKPAFKVMVMSPVWPLLFVWAGIWAFDLQDKLPEKVRKLVG